MPSLVCPWTATKCRIQAESSERKVLSISWRISGRDKASALLDSVTRPQRALSLKGGAGAQRDQIAGLVGVFMTPLGKAHVLLGGNLCEFISAASGAEQGSARAYRVALGESRCERLTQCELLLCPLPAARAGLRSAHTCAVAATVGGQRRARALCLGRAGGGRGADRA